jgi:hypothetical protein
LWQANRPNLWEMSGKEEAMTIRGDSTSAGDPGVYGENTAGGDGVSGKGDRGVVGVSDATPAEIPLVFGRPRPVVAGVFGTSKAGIGVAGQSDTGSGLRGISETGSGIFGASTAGRGIEGRSSTNYGVSGHSRTFAGVRGTSVEVAGTEGWSTNGPGLFGRSEQDDGIFGFTNNPAAFAGVRGRGVAYGVVGEAGRCGIRAEGQEYGLSAEALGVGGGIGVDCRGSRGGIRAFGQEFGLSADGGYPNGIGALCNGSFAGVYATGGGSYWGTGGLAAVVGDSRITPGSDVIPGAAGYFYGDVIVTEGHLEVRGRAFNTGGGFKIDHPSDPANKYLLHSFVEAPNRSNMYDGIATLDVNGEAVIALDDWFEDLNDNFRYQLTAIGKPAPNLHVAMKINSNKFQIAGGEPGMEVCWQVTGMRKDPWALNNPLTVEENKNEIERGKYLHPTLYGQPESMAVGPALGKLGTANNPR